MPRPQPIPPEPDVTELLRQCLTGLTQPVPALAAWIDRMELRQ